MKNSFVLSVLIVLGQTCFAQLPMRRHWEKLGPVEFTAVARQSPTTLVATTNHGYLYSSNDGGVTWEHRLFDDTIQLVDIAFVDSLHGAVAERGGRVYFTDDGGATWDQTYTNDPNLADAGDSLPLGGQKSGLAALNMQTAWVYGVIYAPGTVYLYRTEDGGANWNEQSLPLPQGVENAELSVEHIAFITPNFGFLTMRITSDDINLAVYVSDDSGKTWSLTPTLIPGAGAADFLSANEVVIYNGSQFYVTRDAAHTWSIIPPDVLFGESFAGMDFVNALSGWVITADPTTNHRALYRTSDGGATWFPVIP